MAKVVKASNGLKNNSLGVEEQVNEEEPTESTSLLAPLKGGISKTKSVRKTRRKVQWNDNHGNKLAEVFEYQPSCILSVPAVMKATVMTRTQTLACV